MARSIQLNIAESRYKVTRWDGKRIRIQLSANVNVPLELFAYTIVPVGGLGDLDLVYSHVCSPSDLEEIPANTAQPNATPPWVRLSYVDMLFRSYDESEEFKRLVEEDINRLFDTLETMAAVTPTSTLVIAR